MDSNQPIKLTYKVKRIKRVDSWEVEGKKEVWETHFVNSVGDLVKFYTRNKIDLKPGLEVEMTLDQFGKQGMLGGDQE